MRSPAVDNLTVVGKDSESAQAVAAGIGGGASVKTAVPGEPLEGLNPIDAGPQKRARELEALGPPHMALQNILGTGFASTVKIIA